MLGLQRLGRRAVAGVAGPAGRLGMRLIAQVLGQLDLQRPLDQPLGQLGQQPARPDDLLLAARAGQQLVDHLVRQPAAARQLADRRPHPRTIDRTSTSSRADPRPAARSGSPTPRCARPSGSLRSPPANRWPGSTPESSAPEPSDSVLPRFAILALADIKLLFAHAYTDPRTLPYGASLGVGGSRVDPFGEALGWWDASQRLVRADGVVAGQEDGQGAAAGGAGRVGGGVGPFTQQCLDEALSLAIGLGSVGLGEEVTDAELAADRGVRARAVGRAVVGHQPLDVDPVGVEEGRPRAGETR